MSESALVLAPFSQDALDALSLDLVVIYESWTDTRRLHSPEELSQRINTEGIAILVVEADFVFDEVFQRATCLKFVGVCRNSLDHIDLIAANEGGVTVVHTPGRNSQGVAELTLGLMLCMARGIPRLNDYVKGGEWDSPVEPYISMGGLELQGKILGIVGLGSIGTAVAKLGRAFGMRVLAYDPYVGTPGKRKSVALLTELDDMLTKADFISLHVPETSETNGLLDGRRLGMMKAGAYIINTAAYSAIEEEALVKNLKSGHIAGAALDTHRSHPIPPSSPFLASPMLGLGNVILTPHMGGATDGTVRRQSWMMVEDIRRFLQGRKPRHMVNREVWRRRG